MLNVWDLTNAIFNGKHETSLNLQLAWNLETFLHGNKK